MQVIRRNDRKTVDAKVAKAHLAYTNWKETSYQQRADLFHKVSLMQLKNSTSKKLSP
jgi:succinate-semialdehyde dehydrogenase/glutarate-semialdehyde dehydrogenase